MVWTLEVEKGCHENRNTQGLSKTGKASQTRARKSWDLCIQETEFCHNLND